MTDYRGEFTLDRAEFEPPYEPPTPESIAAERREWDEAEREIEAEREARLALFDPTDFTLAYSFHCGTPRLMEREREVRERLRRRRYPGLPAPDFPIDGPFRRGHEPILLRHRS